MASDGRAEFDPKEIARAAFPTAFRGYDQEAVHRYLTRLAAAIGRAQQTGQLGSVDNHDNAAHLRAAEAEHDAAELRHRVEELEGLLQAETFAAERRQVENEEAAQAAALAADIAVEEASEVEDRPLDESELIEQLGQETARIVEAARSAAADIGQRAEEEASLVKAEATLEARSSKAAAEEALAAAETEAEDITAKAGAEAKKMEARVRADAKRSREHAKSKADKIVADAAGRAESDLGAARQRANQIVVDAEQLREEILGDLVRRRRVNQEQLDRLTAARDRLAQALGAARNELDDVASEIHLAIPNSILDLTQDEDPTRMASDGNEVAELVSQLQGVQASSANGSALAFDGDTSTTGGGVALGPANGHSNGNGSTNGNSIGNGNGAGNGTGASYANGRSRRANGTANGNGFSDDSGLAEGLSDYRADVSPFDDTLSIEDTMQLSVIDLDRQDPDQTLQLGSSTDLDLDGETDSANDGESLLDHDVASDEVSEVVIDTIDTRDSESMSDEDIVEAIVIIDTLDDQGTTDFETAEHDIAEHDIAEIGADNDEVIVVDDAEPADGTFDDQLHDDDDIQGEGSDDTSEAEIDHFDNVPAGFDGPIDGDRLLDQLGFGADPVLGSGSGSMQRSATRGDLPRNTPFAGRLPQTFEGRDVALARSTSGFRRRLKRAVNDDQSDVLDRLRAGRGIIEPDELPPLQEQLDSYVAALRPALNDVVTAGGELLGSSEVPVPALDNLCLQLAKHVVDNLRLPTVVAIEDSADGDREAILDPVRAIYRDFRNTLLPDLIEDALHEAFALGLYYAIDADSLVVWAIDPRLDPDPICEENSASPALAKGTDFPSGHARPLSMPGCRCLAVPAS